MTMKTSYRKIYLFLLLLTSYSCNDLTETNMSIDIILYLANLHTSFLCNLIYPTFSRILLYSC